MRKLSAVDGHGTVVGSQRHGMSCTVCRAWCVSDMMWCVECHLGEELGSLKTCIISEGAEVGGQA